MAPVNANISINMETAKAQAQLRALQTQVASLNKTMAASASAGGLFSGAAMASGAAGAKGMTQTLVQTKNAAAALDSQLAGSARGMNASLKTMSEAFRGQGAAMKLAGRRAQEMSATYQQVGRSVGGMSQQIKTMPPLDMKAAGVGAQRVQIFSRALTQGSTALLAFGKNLQWTGRQMMVGFTLPLTILGGVAAKTFMDMERQIVNFRRVYGDFDTTIKDTEMMTEAIEEQAIAFTKWGITVSESIELAASAAATGLTGDDLLKTTEGATKLATLGMISQEQALDTMISLNSAFKINGAELEETVNFLNAVENQTVLALSDVTEAIPLVAPVIKGLGGDVQDLAVMLTAMREGGVGANEAANALKTGLARLVTPAKAARDRAEELGISLEKIVENNEGDLMGMVNSLAFAMKDLGDLDTQKLLSDLFGKRQFARMGALFSNIADEASQAKRVIDLTAASTGELAALADKELSAIEESTTMRFTAALEQLKVSIAPIGELFLKALTPILEFGTKIAKAFNALEDGDKKIAAFAVGIVGVVVPAVIMLVGIGAQLIAVLGKAASVLLSFFKATSSSGGGVKVLASAINYLSTEQLEAANAAAVMTTNEQALNNTLLVQERLVSNLATQYNRLAATKMGAAAGGRVGGSGAAGALKMATGGKVPGTGSTDKVPALLTPGEFVVKKSQAGKHSGFLSALNNGSVKGFAEGGFNVGPQTSPIQKRLVDWDVPAQEISNAISRGIKQGLSDAQIAKSLKSEFGAKGSYGRFDSKGNVDIQAAHVYPQMQSDAEGVSHALDALEKGTIRLTKAQQVEIRNLDQANKALAKAGLTPVGKAALTTNATYSGEKMMNQALANGGLSGKETAASLGRTSNMGMSVVSKQMSNAGKLSAAQIGKGATAMQKALEAEAAALSANTVVVDKATDDIVAKQKAAGKEVVEFGQIWDKAEKSIQKENAAFVKEQRLLQKEYAQLRIMTTKLTKAQEKVLADAGMSAKNVSRTSRAGNAVNRTVITGAAGTSDSRRGNVESKTILASTKAFDKVAGELRKKGAFAVTNYNAGMMSKIPETTKTGSKVVTAAAKGIQVTQKSNSPSKLFAKLGGDAVAGYVNGILGGTSKAKNAGAKLAGSAAQGAAGSPQVNATAQQKNTAALNGSTASIQRVTLAARTQAVVIQGFNTMTLAATASLGFVARKARLMGGILMRGSGKLSGIVGAATGAVFAMSMFEGPMQQLSQKIMPFVFGIGAIQQLLPLFSNPWMIAIGAVVALGASIWYLNKTTNDAADASAEYARTMMGAAADAQKFSDQFGNLSNMEKGAARKLKRETGESMSEGDIASAKEFIEAEFGKEFIERIKSAQNFGGTNEAATALANNLTRQIANGTISESLAKAIANEVGTALDDQDIGISAIMNINEIIGPNGDDYLKDPLRITTELLVNSRSLDEVMNNAGLQWDGQRWFTQVAMIIKGQGTADLVAEQAFAQGAEQLKIIEEGEAALSQSIADGVITAKEATEQFAKLNEQRKLLTTANNLENTKGEIDFKFGEGTFDRKLQDKFYQGILDSFEGTAMDKLGKEKGEEFIEGIEEGLKTASPSYDNLGGFFDAEDTNTRMENLQRDLGEALDRGNAKEIEAIQKEIEDLDKYFNDVIGTMDAINSGLITLNSDLSMEDAIDSWKSLNKEVAGVKWLLGEIGMDSGAAQALAALRDAGGSGSSAGIDSSYAEISAAFVEASIVIMQAGGNIDDVLAAMDGNIADTTAASKDFAKLMSDEFFDLPQKEQKVFQIDFLTNTVGWNKDEVDRYLALSDKEQKSFMLQFTTEYIEIGTPSAALERAGGDINAARLEGQRSEQNVILGMQEAAQNKDPDVKDEGDDDRSGSKALSWVEEQEKAYREASAIYGNTLKSKKGFMDQLVKGGKLDTEILKAAKGNFEAMQELANMTEKQQEVFNKQFMQTQRLNAQGSIDVAIDAQKRTTKAIKDMRQSTMTEEMAKFIQGNQDLMTLYSTGGTKSKTAATKGAKALMDSIEEAKSPLDKIRDFYKEIKSVYSNISKVIGSKNTIAAKGLEDSLGIDDEALKRTNQNLNKQINMIQVGQINPINKKIEAEEEVIDGIEREIELLERGTEQYEDQTKALNKQVEQLNRADEIRMRESDMLSHDLKLMGYKEEQINETYNKRIESLTKVQNINQQIAQSQKQQLGLASALSRGDVSAAASAAQQMQQGAMQNAATQFRAQLETSKQSQLDSLTGAESGMTRDQISERQRELEEQSYYTKLKVRDIEDEIYNLDMLISAEQDKIDIKTKSIRLNTDAIRVFEDQILAIKKEQVKPLQAQIDANQKEIDHLDLLIDTENMSRDIKIANLNEEANVIEAVGNLEIEELKVLEEQGSQIQMNTAAMINFGKAGAAAYNAIQSGKFNYQGSSLDNMRSMKTSELQKNLTAGLSNIVALSARSGSDTSFNIPGSAVGAKAVSGIMGNITTNNNNVNVNAQGASAVEVADIVIRQLDMRNGRSIGGAG